MWPIDRQIDPFYEQVYRWFPDRTFDNVLIVGAGSGTDVAVALEHGAGHVDAVEIDPRHPGRSASATIPNTPYDDPRVTRDQRRRPGVPARHDTTTTTSWSSRCPTR